MKQDYKIVYLPHEKVLGLIKGDFLYVLKNNTLSVLDRTTITYRWIEAKPLNDASGKVGTLVEITDDGIAFFMDSKPLTDACKHITVTATSNEVEKKEHTEHSLEKPLSYKGKNYYFVCGKFSGDIGLLACADIRADTAWVWKYKDGSNAWLLNCNLNAMYSNYTADESDVSFTQNGMRSKIAYKPFIEKHIAFEKKQLIETTVKPVVNEKPTDKRSISINYQDEAYVLVLTHNDRPGILVEDKNNSFKKYVLEIEDSGKVTLTGTFSLKEFNCLPSPFVKSTFCLYEGFKFVIAVDIAAFVKSCKEIMNARRYLVFSVDNKQKTSNSEDIFQLYYHTAENELCISFKDFPVNSGIRNAVFLSENNSLIYKFVKTNNLKPVTVIDSYDGRKGISYPSTQNITVRIDMDPEPLLKAFRDKTASVVVTNGA